MAKAKTEKAEKLLENVEEIQKQAGESPFAEQTISENDKGETFLPGAEITVTSIKALNDAVRLVKTKLVPDFQTAQKALSNGKKQVEFLAEKYKEHFHFDAETGIYTYDDGAVHLEIEEKESITYDLIDENGEKKGVKK